MLAPYTDETDVWLEAANVSQVTRKKLMHLPRDQELDEASVSEWLAEHLPSLGVQTRKVVVDALAVADQIRALKPPAPSAGLYTSHGKPLLEASVDTLEHEVGEISIVVHRAELLAILRSALDDGSIHLGRPCTRIEQDATGCSSALRCWCDPIEALIGATTPEGILHHDVADRTPIRSWSNGRITLLGDAAHPMTPNLGQDGCQALEDAVVLGNCLRTYADPVVAFRSYEQQRSARTRQIVQQSRRVGQIGQWSNPWLCGIRNVLVRAAAPIQHLAASCDRVSGKAEVVRSVWKANRTDSMLS